MVKQSKPVNGAPDILELLIDLHKQATTEKSHYYTAKVITAAIKEIASLRLKISRLQDKGNGKD